MSSSPLVVYTRISPNSNNPRSKPIAKITPHHMAGNLSIETCGNLFASASRQASSNYGIGTDGRIGMYVEEKNRSWCSSSAANDHQAITIEVANDSGAPDWRVSDKALAALIELCVDICQRNGIPRLNFTGGAAGNLTQHNYFAATACPGPYLKSKFPYIAQEVNKRLTETAVPPAAEAPPTGEAEGTIYCVQVGAFTKKANADAVQSKLKEKGYDTYMVQGDGLYKVQVGAYAVKANADARAAQLKSDGFDTYITTKSGTAASGNSSDSIVVGGKVKVRTGAKTYIGGGLASFVYTNVYDVIQINGERVVIGKGRDVTAAVNIADLTRM